MHSICWILPATDTPERRLCFLRDMLHRQTLDTHLFVTDCLDWRPFFPTATITHILQQYCVYFHHERVLLGATPEGFLSVVLRTGGVRLGTSANEEMLREIFTIVYAAWLNQPSNTTTTQSEGEIAVVRYMADADVSNSVYPSWLRKPYDDLPTILSEDDIALRSNIHAQEIVANAAPRAMWDAPLPLADGAPRSPWFLCWDDRHEEATKLLTYLVGEPVVTFLDEYLLDFHLGNFHRLHLLCTVDIRAYIRHVLVLGYVPTPGFERRPEVLINCFQRYYQRWSGLTAPSVQLTPSATPDMSLPFSFMVEECLDRHGRGEGLLYREGRGQGDA
ncbi:hypothetical protein PUNSTDRAFT_139558 [Punctularia strigosozonata HHB-11173 SS5]|uniref:Uncharacterized protein n=1 Tax=Punctularia strigosozonata (strain HHB-11173) TaxID=741275 RepID=R7S0V4_PUNST|nr:uncharacterized protein PUNSTDRAFT_139558 [Punctularia strigosozonata HHB-11173 SS5]EIN03427.1 hypothetical protein PUNSTDRAFT_139558 [Punctularia strigosozonata HHB-11173 SS5]